MEHQKVSERNTKKHRNEILKNHGMDLTKNTE